MPKIYDEKTVLQKKFLGTVEVARIIGMSRITVHGWIKQGDLKAVRTPGRHFRVRPSDLVSFLRSKGAYIPEELRQAVEKRFLVVGAQQPTLELLHQAFKEVSGDKLLSWDVQENPLGALMAMGAMPPDVIILCTPLPGIRETDMIRQMKTYHAGAIIAVAAMEKAAKAPGEQAMVAESTAPYSVLSGPSADDLKAAGAAEVFPAGTPPKEIAQRILSLI